MNFEVRITICYYFEKTNETDIYIHLNLDGTGKSKIETGIAFFDHMLDQIARHGQMDLEILVKEI
jgi:imidazoleglycerol-phosphate dehydratase/histidinol-phosphatase